MELIERPEVSRHRPKNENYKQFTPSFKYFAIFGLKPD